MENQKPLNIEEERITIKNLVLIILGSTAFAAAFICGMPYLCALIYKLP